MALYVSVSTLTLEFTPQMSMLQKCSGHQVKCAYLVKFSDTLVTHTYMPCSCHFCWDCTEATPPLLSHSDQASFTVKVTGTRETINLLEGTEATPLSFSHIKSTLKSSFNKIGTKM